MAPNSKKRSRTRRTATKATKPRKPGLKKRPIQLKVQEFVASSIPSMASISTKKDNSLEDEDDKVSTSNCSTPKGQRFRIPKIETCPPAPRKKPRMVSNCYLQRRPIAFFASPDIELFFYQAFRGISV